METNQGIIKRLMTRKKFGFIIKEDGTDIFFHACGVINCDFDSLREGAPVEFFITSFP